ncbi:MAG: hypothetical protein D6704_11740 [Nitrospirae bacterium]|nr:MAG: hypothetical protein D6704_11740 [Nitrospirota bacterium]
MFFSLLSGHTLVKSCEAPLWSCKVSCKRQVVWVWVAFFMFQAFLQGINGAYWREFGGHPDEAAHYITGLMVRDYVAQGISKPPMEFAENYYLHYPKVAFGHWPPLFYLVQAGWTLVFSASRLSLCMLMALLTATLALLIFQEIQEEVGILLAFGAGVIFIALPLIQQYSGMVMAEILVALLSFLAIRSFWQFLQSEQWKDARRFGVWATLAILTKGNALALGLMPAIALAVNRQFTLLKNPALWGAACIVGVVCAPVYWLTLDMVRNAWQEQSPSLQFVTAALPYYGLEMMTALGSGLATMAVIGVGSRILQPAWKGTISGKWAVVGAWLVSMWVFHGTIPSSLEARNLVPALPALVMVAAVGCAWCLDRLTIKPSYRHRVIVGLLLLAIGFGVSEAMALPKPGVWGFGKVAELLLSTQKYARSVILVSSDTRGEGAFIAEMARREDRPGHIVLRASKVLSKSGWNKQGYRRIFSTDEQLEQFLKSIPVGVVVLDTSLTPEEQDPHHQQLVRVLEANPDLWQLIATYPLHREGKIRIKAIRVYEQRGHEKRPVSTIRVDMHNMLNKVIELHP